jgi:ankyrin repeat protein
LILQLDYLKTSIFSVLAEKPIDLKHYNFCVNFKNVDATKETDKLIESEENLDTIESSTVTPETVIERPKENFIKVDHPPDQGLNASSTHDETLNEFIRFKRLIYSVDSNMNSILHLGANRKSIKTLNLILYLLIDNRISFLNLFRKKNINGETFFQLACNQDCAEVVEIILKHKSALDINYDPLNDHDNNLNTPLLSAVQHSQFRCVSLLLEYGANSAAENQAKQNGLHLSCMIGSYEITECLIKYACPYVVLDSLKMNPLDYACQNGNVEVVRLLLTLEDANFLISQKCLDYAIEGNHPYVADVLFKCKHWQLLIKNEESPLISNLIEKMVRF